jgi:hypothetical protein
VTDADPARPPDANGWYRAPVAIAFSGSDGVSGISSCTTATYSGPDGAAAATPGTCTDHAGNVSAPFRFRLNYDATEPSVNSAQATRAPDSNGWYNHPVGVAFSGNDATSGVLSCTATEYRGPDDASAAVPGTCTDRAGNTSSALGFALKYDATGPAVTGAHAERAPDQGDWFLKPVRFDFTGTDATSGIDACPSVIYSGPDGPSVSGPDGPSVSVTGVCRDLAGNVSQRAFPLKFDGNPPIIAGLDAAPGDRRLVLSWQMTVDVISVSVVRRAPVDGQPGTPVFQGLARTFTDDHLDNGVRYTYDVTVKDRAGNKASASVSGTPTAAAQSKGTAVTGRPRRRTKTRGLLGPLPGATVSARRPPLLRWLKVRKARYYNVQLHTRGRKILTAWPTKPRYRLRTRWTYAGKVRHLRPGRYRWMVWPGFGRRSKANYGRLIGQSTFVVRR